MTSTKEAARGNGQVTTGPDSLKRNHRQALSQAQGKPLFGTRQAAAEDAARQLVYSWCEHGRHAANDFPPDRMPNATLCAIAERLAPATAGCVIGWPDAMPLFSEEHLRAAFIEATEGTFPPSPAACRPLVAMLAAFHRDKRSREIADAIRQAIEAGEEVAPLLDQLRAIETEATGKAGIADLLAERVFDFTKQPPPPVPLFKLAGMPVSTPGNLTNIQAQVKAGKSAVIDSLLAAVMNGNRQGPDTLGFSAENPQGHAILHLDTEQSRFDADSLVRRAIRRAMLTEPPPWLESYSIADLGIYERRQTLRHVMAEAGRKHGGIFAVMIDGIGDLCADPNDPEEAFELVRELHARAIEHDCGVVTVLHENPGSVSGKTRGHLGSELERKAETNLRLAKDAAGVTTIWSERSRHCYLLKDAGPCFAWSDERKMHMSCGTAGEMKQAACREKMLAEAEAAFGDGESMKHSELMAAIGEALELKERAAKKRIQTWLAEGITRKDSAGIYHISNP